jgi:hypothetical protein
MSNETGPDDTGLDGTAAGGIDDGAGLSLLPLHVMHNHDDSPDSPGAAAGSDGDEERVFEGLDDSLGDTATLSPWPRRAEGVWLELELEMEQHDAHLQNELSSAMASGGPDSLQELISPPTTRPSEPSEEPALKSSDIPGADFRKLFASSDRPVATPAQVSSNLNPLQLLMQRSDSASDDNDSLPTTRSDAVGAGLFFRPKLYVRQHSQPLSDALAALVIQSSPRLEKKRKRRAIGDGRRVRRVRK